jgi:regulatory protein YycI of two-component signal transduction system YycFG
VSHSHFVVAILIHIFLAKSHVNQLQAQDRIIEEQNAALKSAKEGVQKAIAKLSETEQRLIRGTATTEQVQRAEQAKVKALKVWQRARKASQTTRDAGIGSGDVYVELYDL